MWEAATGREVAWLVGHDAMVLSVWSPLPTRADGALLINNGLGKHNVGKRDRPRRYRSVPVLFVIDDVRSEERQPEVRARAQTRSLK
jgi:hypothetical protein